MNQTLLRKGKSIIKTLRRTKSCDEQKYTGPFIESPGHCDEICLVLGESGQDKIEARPERNVGLSRLFYYLLITSLLMIIFESKLK